MAFRESFTRFTLVVKITKFDPKGELLRRLMNGIVIGFHNLNDALATQGTFHAFADSVLQSNLGHKQGHDYSSYGLSTVVDEQDGVIHNPLHLGLVQGSDTE